MLPTLIIYWGPLYFVISLVSTLSTPSWLLFFNYKYYYLVSYSCLYVVIMQVTTPKAQTICCCHCHRTSELWNFQSAFQILGVFHIFFLRHEIEFKLCWKDIFVVACFVLEVSKIRFYKCPITYLVLYACVHTLHGLNIISIKFFNS